MLHTLCEDLLMGMRDRRLLTGGVAVAIVPLNRALTKVGLESAFALPRNNQAACRTFRGCIAQMQPGK